MEAEAGTTLLLSVRGADLWCWGVREGRPVKSSGRLAVASGAAAGGVCPGALPEDTEVSARDLQGLSRTSSAGNYTAQGMKRYTNKNVTEVMQIISKMQIPVNVRLHWGLSHTRFISKHNLPWECGVLAAEHSHIF